MFRSLLRIPPLIRVGSAFVLLGGFTYSGYLIGNYLKVNAEQKLFSPCARLMISASNKQINDAQLVKRINETPTLNQPDLTKDRRKRALDQLVAQELGYFGANQDEASRIEQVCQELANFYDSFFGVLPSLKGTDRSSFLQNFQEQSLPKLLTQLESIAAANTNEGYFVGSKLSLADFTGFVILNSIDNIFSKSVSDYPRLLLIIQNVRKVKEKS